MKETNCDARTHAEAACPHLASRKQTDKLRSKRIKMSCAAKQWKYCSQLIAGSVSHTGAAVRFKLEYKHTFRESVRFLRQCNADTHKRGQKSRLPVLNTELCTHSFQR